MFMDKESIRTNFSCADCHTCACQKGVGVHPKFCLTTNDFSDIPIADELEKIKKTLTGDTIEAHVMQTAATVEGTYFGRMTRVEEVCEFAKRLGVKKIGIATCHGLIRETRAFTKILQAKGIDYYVAACKVGGIDKTEVGILDEMKIHPGTYEPTCNPILQAKILNSQKTDLNVIVGLCVGHDSLFIKYSDALCTTLITKDRVLGHAPALALYTMEEYYTRLLDKE